MGPRGDSIAFNPPAAAARYACSTCIGDVEARYDCQRLNHSRFHGLFCAWLVLCSCGIVLPAVDDTDAKRRPARCWPRSWFWNDTEVTAGRSRTDAEIRSSRYGFGILPFGKSSAYLSEEYFAIYGAALEQARRLSMTMSLYDSTASQRLSRRLQPAHKPFQQRYPNLTLKGWTNTSDRCRTERVRRYHPAGNAHEHRGDEYGHARTGTSDRRR